MDELTKVHLEILKELAQPGTRICRSWRGASRSGYMRHLIYRPEPEFRKVASGPACENLRRKGYLINDTTVKGIGRFSDWIITDKGRAAIAKTARMDSV